MTDYYYDEIIDAPFPELDYLLRNDPGPAFLEEDAAFDPEYRYRSLWMRV